MENVENQLQERVKILGYPDRFSVLPGGKIEFKLSSVRAGSCQARFLRIRLGDNNPDGPGAKATEMPHPAAGVYDVRPQATAIGSYARFAQNDIIPADGSFSFYLFAKPTAPGRGPQGLLGRFDATLNAGYLLSIEDGVLTARVGSRKLQLRTPLMAEHWYAFGMSYDRGTGHLSLFQRLVRNSVNSRTSPAIRVANEEARQDTVVVEQIAVALPNTPFLIAAYSSGSDVVGHFNGKIDSPAVLKSSFDQAEFDLLCEARLNVSNYAAFWDFSREITESGVASDAITDISGNGHHGNLINQPARAVTGRNWTGNEERFIHCPREYSAIHFHEDDLDDVRWETTLAVSIPEDWRSGIYALAVKFDDYEDQITFVVLPSARRPKAKVLFLAPIFTYLAYANQQSVSKGPIAQALYGRVSVLSDLDLYLNSHRHLGASCYERHADGEGRRFSTFRRPIVQLRPNWRHHTAGVWALPADLHIIDWLDELEIDYDVITDHELHTHGADALKDYKVVVTGAHPEYYSSAMLDAWEEYLAGGGRGMYLGGNGFYWVTSVHPEKPYLIEVRRGESGERAWGAEPGEYFHATTAERGGLWRARNRAPQKLFGVGMTSDGFDYSGHYNALPDWSEPSVSFIVENLNPEEPIGNFGLIGNGASGVEIDRADFNLGTPPEAKVIATSAGTHSNNWAIVPEELTFIYAGIGGQEDHRVRADITYFETNNGGAVFSTGSVAWAASLSYNNYSNNVSKMTENVIRKFMA